MKTLTATVLPFGAVRSVGGFLRCDRAFWWIGVVACRVLWVSFYDDFVAFTWPSLMRRQPLSSSRSLDGFSLRKGTSARLLGLLVLRWVCSLI